MPAQRLRLDAMITETGYLVRVRNWYEFGGAKLIHLLRHTFGYEMSYRMVKLGVFEFYDAPTSSIIKLPCF